MHGLVAQGKGLTAVCRVVFTEFAAASEKLSRAEYDALESECKQFETDAAAFKALLREFDERIAAVILQVCRRWGAETR